MKRILGLILVSMMLMTMILPVSAVDSALDGVTRSVMTKSVGESDATFVGDALDLNFDGVTFTSSDSAVIDPETGVVARPEQTKSVILTATAGDEKKEFAFRIPGMFENVPVESVVYYDDFEDGVLSSHVIKDTHSRETMESDGVLSFASNVADSQGGEFLTGALKLKEDRSVVTGKIHIEFQLKRSHSDHISRIYFNGNDSSYHALFLDWGESRNQGDGTFITDINIDSAADKGSSARVTRTVTATSADKYVLALKVSLEYDSETGAFKLWLNDEEVTFENNGGYILRNNSGVKEISFANYHSKCNPWMESFVCKQSNAASAGRADVYSDDFNDGTLSTHVGTTSYSQANMEEGGYLSFGSNDASGATMEVSTGSLYLKEDRSVVTGKTRIEFSLTRSYSWYATRIYFNGNDSRMHAFLIDWGAPASGQVEMVINSTATQGGTSRVNKTITKSTDSWSWKDLKITVEYDSATGAFDLWLNDEKVDFGNEGGYLLYDNTGIKEINFTNYHTDCNPKMDYIKCEQIIEKQPVTNMTFDYNSYDKKVSVVSPDAKAVTVIAVAYKGIGTERELISAVPVTGTLVAGGSALFDTSELVVAGADSISLYAWDGLETLRPICANDLIESTFSTN